ncbi:MAG: NDP-sugar synthase [Elusimicrobiota bacterium]
MSAREELPRAGTGSKASSAGGPQERFWSAGIIAAGRGSRLHDAYPGTVKPMVPVGGKPLIYWVVSSLRAAGVRSLVVLLNSSGDPARAYLQERFAGLTMTFLREDTASSWESFRLVSRRLAERAESFMISTVDALIPPEQTRRFAREALAPFPASGSEGRPAAALALTRFVEDEKPLWADVDAGGLVTALGPAASRREAVTCGLYSLGRPVTAAMPAASAHGRLRDFWTDLLKSGRPVRGVLLADSVDVDRPEDLPAAERMTSCFGA